MKSANKKAALAAYKERKIPVGIFAVRCAASAEAWVGQSPNLQAIQNRLWFALRLGSCEHKDLQKAWNDYGAGNVTFDVLERMTDEEPSFDRDTLLKERTAHWRKTLGAKSI